MHIIKHVIYLNKHNAYQLVSNPNYDMNICTSWKTNLSNQTTSLLRPLWLRNNGGLNSEVLLYTKDTRCNKGPTQSNDIRTTLNSLGKCLIQEPK